jgi:hypothetical protein
MKRESTSRAGELLDRVFGNSDGSGAFFHNVSGALLHCDGQQPKRSASKS